MCQRKILKGRSEKGKSKEKPLPEKAANTRNSENDKGEYRKNSPTGKNFKVSLKREGGGYQIIKPSKSETKNKK